MSLVSKSEFGRMHSVSHTAVKKWEKAGWLAMQGSQVDVEASNAKLARYRDSKDSRASRRSKKVSSGLKPETKNETCDETQVSSSAGTDQISFLPGESVEQAAERLAASMAEVDLSMPVEEARRIKEVYLALLNRLDYEVKSGALIDLALAQGVLFDEFRTQRDAWLNWPVKVGPILAADLGIDDSDRVTECLAVHVHKQITDLGEISADFSSEKN